MEQNKKIEIPVHYQVLLYALLTSLTGLVMSECFRSTSRANIERLRYEQLRDSIETQKAIKQQQMQKNDTAKTLKTFIWGKFNENSK